MLILPDLAAISLPLLGIADAAGQGIMEIYRASAAEVTFKADDSPLTQADLSAHRIIVSALAELTPRIPVVSEEDEDSLQWRQPTGLFWLIDPLDGTKEFIARNDEFTVNIALIQNGISIFGVVTAPALDLAYWGGIGVGAYRRAAGLVSSLHVTAPAHPLRVVSSKSHMNEETRQRIEQLGPHELVQIGSSLKFCLLAEGKADYYPRLGPTSEWDTAAAQAVLEAAGGSVCTLEGVPLRYAKTNLRNPYFIASTLVVPQGRH